MIARILSTFTVLALPAAALANGAWSIDLQFRFPSPEGVQIIGPFVDGEANPWVLGNHLENAECHLIGPFDQNTPPTEVWRVTDGSGDEQPSNCIAVEPGAEDGFLIRGYIPPPPLTDEPPLGFIVSVDADFQTRWTTFDEEHTELGVYGEPLAPVAWSPERNRVMTFFNGFVTLGTETVGQLHGLSIADNTGIVRRTVTSWGQASTGELQGLLVLPEDGRFLVVAHQNGTLFVLYDGVETIEEYPAGGEIDWSTQSIDYLQFADDSLFIVHHPRLDLEGIDTSLTRVVGDGEFQYYTRDLEKTLELENLLTGEMFEVTFPRPILSYVTDTTATFVRNVEGDFVLHTYDNFNGAELAIQSLTSIDENIPTHMADARQPDRLVLMTADDTGQRFVDLIAWDPSAETPLGYPQPEDTDSGDSGGDAGIGSDGGTGGGGGDSGCCSVAGRRDGVGGRALLALALLGLVAWRRGSRGGRAG